MGFFSQAWLFHKFECEMVGSVMGRELLQLIWEPGAEMLWSVEEELIVAPSLIGRSSRSAQSIRLLADPGSAVGKKKVLPANARWSDRQAESHASGKVQARGAAFAEEGWTARDKFIFICCFDLGFC